MNARSLGRGVAVLVCSLTLASCAAAGPTTETASPTTTVAPPTGTAPSSTSTTQASTSTPSPSPSRPTDSETSAAVATEKAGSPLSLSDFFRPASDWSENRFDVADKSQVSGISSEVRTFYESDAKTLELRLANNFTTLSFSVGQANESTSSEQTLVVKVMGNGKQLDVHRVPFNTIQKVSVPVRDVNAAKIRIYLDDANRKSYDSVLAVISDVKAE